MGLRSDVGTELSVTNLARAVQTDLGTRVLFKDISFELRSERSLGLLGPKGSGKSSIVRAILGLDPVSIGTVKLDGIPMIESGIAAFRENVRGLLDDPAVLRIDALSLLRSGFLTRGRLGADLERLTLELEQVSLTLGLRDSDLNSPLCDADEQTLVLIWIALLVALGPKLLVLDDPARCRGARR
jgi:ABC-type cobalamin/Fe3+-siderophores transport system ATPase subunit